MVGDNIRRIRKQKGLTQIQLAEKLGIKPQQVTRWEKTPNANIKLNNIDKIAAALECTRAQLLAPTTDLEKTIAATHAEILEHYGIPAEMDTLFNQLNDTGKQEAVKRVEELTHIEKYTAEQKRRSGCSSAAASLLIGKADTLKRQDKRQGTHPKNARANARQKTPL